MLRPYADSRRDEVRPSPARRTLRCAEPAAPDGRTGRAGRKVLPIVEGACSSRRARAAGAAGLPHGVRDPRDHPRAVRAVVRSGLGLCRHHELWPGLVLRLGRLWRRAARARPRHHQHLPGAPCRHDHRLHRAAARRLPAARTASLQRHLRRAGHPDRLLRRRSPRARLVLSRRPERHPLDPADVARRLTN